MLYHHEAVFEPPENKAKDFLTELLLSQVLELPQALQDDVADQHVFLLIGGKPGAQQVSLLPDSSHSKAFLASLTSDVFFWQADRTTGVLVCSMLPCQSTSQTKSAANSSQTKASWHP